jgi:hypothetical protein
LKSLAKVRKNGEISLYLHSQLTNVGLNIWQKYFIHPQELKKQKREVKPLFCTPAGSRTYTDYQ